MSGSTAKDPACRAHPDRGRAACTRHRRRHRPARIRTDPPGSPSAPQDPGDPGLLNDETARSIDGTGAVDRQSRRRGRSRRRGFRGGRHVGDPVVVTGHPGPANDHRQGPGRAPESGGCADTRPTVPARRHTRAAPWSLPGHGAGPPVRPGGQCPAAPGSAGHLGTAAGPGGRADRCRPGNAAAGLRVPVLPRARRRLVSGRRPDGTARHLPGHRPLRLGSGQDQVPRLHDRDRQPGAQRHRVRHGPAAGRQGRLRRSGRA